MAKFEAGDRVQVNSIAGNEYVGMVGTVYQTRLDSYVCVDMDFRGDETRRFSAADYKNWIFPQDCLDKLVEASEVVRAPKTVELMEGIEAAAMHAFDSAESLRKQGFDVTAKPLYADATVMLKFANRLRAALEEDGIEVPDRKED